MGRSLHILFIGLSWPPETFLARLIRGLLANGVNVTVATSRKPEAAWLQSPGFSWVFAPNWEGPTPLRLLRLGRMGGRAALGGRRDLSIFSQHSSGGSKRIADRGRYWNRLLPFAGRRWDVLYFPWNSGAIVYLPLFDLGMPVVISCRGTHINIAPHNPERSTIRQGLQETLAKASAIHCVSHAIQVEAEAFGATSDKVQIIHPAVDPDFFCPGNVPKVTGTFNLITTGSLIWRKGYEYALAAVRELVDRDIPVEFHIIGNGPERERLLFTIHDLGLERHVTLHGKLSPLQVRNRLQAADLFVLSSLSEGISNAVLEAMACGLPVVTTNCGGMREAVTNGVEGLVVPVRDPAAMAKAVQELWKFPNLRGGMGRNGRQRILRDFSLDAQTHKFIDLFEQITSKAHSS